MVEKKRKKALPTDHLARIGACSLLEIVQIQMEGRGGDLAVQLTIGHGLHASLCLAGCPMK
jgi:hypothetical protein